MKDTVRKFLRKQIIDEEKIFVKHTSDKRTMFKIYKELLKLSKKMNTTIKKQAEYLSKKDLPRKICRWQVSIGKDAPQHMYSGKCKLNKI